jgi:hypothetical protein
MYPSKYLSKEDIKRPVVATIQSVTREQMEIGKKEIKSVLHFAGGELKPMILNRGNGKILFACLGDDSSAWTGKQVEIYVDPNVMFGGDIVGGLRVRMPATGSANGNVWTWPEAVDAAKRAGMNEEALKAILKQNDKTGYLPSRDTAFVKQLVADLQHVNEPTASGSEIPFSWLLLPFATIVGTMLS